MLTSDQAERHQGRWASLFHAGRNIHAYMHHLNQKHGVFWPNFISQADISNHNSATYIKKAMFPATNRNTHAFNPGLHGYTLRKHV